MIRRLPDVLLDARGCGRSSGSCQDSALLAEAISPEAVRAGGPPELHPALPMLSGSFSGRLGCRCCNSIRTADVEEEKP